MLLLSDQVEETTRRDREAAEVGKDVEQGRRDVARELARLLGGNEQVPEPDDRDRDRISGPSGAGADEGMEVDRPDGDDQRDTRATDTTTTGQSPPRNGSVDSVGEVDDDEDDDDGFEQVA